MEAQLVYDAELDAIAGLSPHSPDSMTQSESSFPTQSPKLENSIVSAGASMGKDGAMGEGSAIPADRPRVIEPLLPSSVHDNMIDEDFHEFFLDFISGDRPAWNHVGQASTTGISTPGYPAWIIGSVATSPTALGSNLTLFSGSSTEGQLEESWAQDGQQQLDQLQPARKKRRRLSTSVPSPVVPAVVDENSSSRIRTVPKWKRDADGAVTKTKKGKAHREENDSVSSSTSTTAGSGNSRMKKPQKSRSLQRSSQFRGVSRCSKDGRWQARIRIGSAVRYLGRFATQEEAARCYDSAAREHHGSKAILNFAVASGVEVVG